MSDTPQALAAQINDSNDLARLGLPVFSELDNAVEDYAKAAAQWPVDKQTLIAGTEQAFRDAEKEEELDGALKDRINAWVEERVSEKEKTLNLSKADERVAGKLIEIRLAKLTFLMSIAKLRVQELRVLERGSNQP